MGPRSIVSTVTGGIRVTIAITGCRYLTTAGAWSALPGKRARDQPTGREWIRMLHGKGGRAVTCRNCLFLALVCVLTAPTLTRGGWPFSADGPRRGTREYYEMHAGAPVGQRQQYKAGKLWPPDPRVAGEPLPWLHRFHAAHYWPHPYNEMDRMSVRAIVDAHIAAGWETSCTLHDYHFDTESQTLNSAGRAHLQWILQNVPAAHRQAFVASTVNPEMNAQRLTRVESAVTGLIGQDHSLPVMLRMATPNGRPAAEVQAIFQGRIDSMPAPVINYTSVGTAGP